MSTEQAELAAVREDVIARGKRIYDERLRGELEPDHTGRYVAVEPDTGRYFLGDTSADAVGAAHDAMPGSRFYLARVGYDAAHSIGGYGLHRG
ncbi:MAG TPA: hypothetical protein VN282_21460 [Pyrinomonadaceae bacterium]|nr:hypothetical protein [Pyrinomonadaceae bacterium]